MQTLTPQQARQVHGAGPIETAELHWFIYSLTNGGLVAPHPLDPIQF